MSEDHSRRLGKAESKLLTVGDQAPSFRLRRTFDELVSLEDLVSRGPVLIAFYVFDFGNV